VVLGLLRYISSLRGDCGCQVCRGQVTIAGVVSLSYADSATVIWSGVSIEVSRVHELIRFHQRMAEVVGALKCRTTMREPINRKTNPVDTFDNDQQIGVGFIEDPVSSVLRC